MSNTLTHLAKLLKPISGQPDVLVGVKIHPQAVSLAEIRFDGTAALSLVSLVSKSLPRAVDFKNIQRSQEMIAEAIRTAKDEAQITATDAAICLPGQIVQLRVVNLPYMSAKEFNKEARSLEFWMEVEPDIGKIDDPHFQYQVLIASENDDLMRVLLAFADRNALEPWCDIILAAHHNPVFMEAENLALVNLMQTQLFSANSKQSQAIVQMSPHGCQCIAFEAGRKGLPDKFHSIKLEVSEFDLVLLDQAEETEEALDGEFWDEVAGRIANLIKQALLYLAEEHDFRSINLVTLVSEYPRCKEIVPLLAKHLEIAQLNRFEPFSNLRFTEETKTIAESYANPSLLTTVLGTATQCLGTYGDSKARHISINMLPQYLNLRRGRQLKMIARTLMGYFVISVLGLGAWSGGFTLPQYLESQRISRDYDNLRLEDERITIQLDGAKAALQKTAQQIEKMRQLQESSGKIVLMETLPDLIPEETELDSLTINESDKITLTGFARTGKAIFFFQNELANSGLISGITIITQNENDNFISFTLKGNLEVVE